MTTTTSRHAVAASPIGPLTYVVDDRGLAGVYYPGHWTDPDQLAWGPRVDAAHDAGFAEPLRQLHEYFTGTRRAFDLRLSLHGSERARRLWAMLAEIPYGATTTYGALAARLGDGISPRAVGGLVGHNPVSVVLPCHRVVGSTGSLTGYAGGLERKQFLLELEGAIPARTPALW